LYFYPLFGANTLIMYYHLLQSIQKKYSPSWYFLVATTPIALVSILEVSSDFNGVPVQTIHDIYYAGTFIEMFFLTIGIVYRFRLERTNLQILQQELFVTEIKAQDRERERIARDLHDNIGASIVGIQMMLNAFSEKFFVDKETPEDFKKTIEYLEKTSHDIRELSHELTPQILTNLGLVEQIKEKYGFISKPVFKLTMPTETIILDPFIELTLYKIINEAVQNTLKHAEATEIGIELSKDNKNLKLRIEDNGIGFDLAQRKGNGIGLSNIKFRAENQLNGTLTIESSPGNGTIILVKINLKAIPKTVVQ
jgi:signal transduction histidine kinase